MNKTYPNTVSRTLNQDLKSFVTVIGRHDKRLTDAELNLIQDIQDAKRLKIFQNTTFSGCLNHQPFMFDTTSSLFLKVPAFDVLFGGEIVTIGGNRDTNLALNTISIPTPIQWDGGSSADDARVLVVYLEIWIKALESESGTGYAIVGSNQYFYPNGCVDADSSNYILDDTVDPFQGVATSARAQIQWAIRTETLPLAYNFDKYQFGLDPAITPDVGKIFGRGSIPTGNTPTTYTFENMGSINGDSGLWVAGNGNTLNGLQTMDGYTYAMPICVLFQRNTGFYSVDNNPYGCGSFVSSNSGTLVSGISGRLDGKYADVVYSDDVVDTRLTVSLTGYDYDKLLSQSFTDLITGETNIRIARGESPGSKSTLLGSKLEYTISVNASATLNTDTIGAFDYFRNGFSSDERSYTVVETRAVDQKVNGTSGAPWALNDSVVLQLNADVNPEATIDSLTIQSLVNNSDGSQTPVTLFGGQISVTGLSTRIVVVTLAQDFTGTQFDIGSNPIIISAKVTYPSGLGQDLRKIVDKIQGGSLYDTALGFPVPVFGVSDYQIKADQNKQTIHALYSYNPMYSNTIFGTRAEVVQNISEAVQVTVGSNVLNTFTIPRINIDNHLFGLYVVSARNLSTGESFTIVDQGVRVDSTNCYVTIAGNIPGGTDIVFTHIIGSTAQVGYNPAVKGISTIEETVQIGVGTISDSRVTVASVTRFADRNEIVLYSNKVLIKGISGNDTSRFIWVFDISTNSYVSYPISDISFNLGIVKITVPPIVNLSGNQKFFVVASLLPMLDKSSSLTLVTTYKPYQGEGKEGVEYSLVNAEGVALLTTNGTGAAPIIGIKDVFPYKRELPIITTLPALVTWADSDLANQSLSGDLSNNFEDKRASNVEHTIPVNMYTNDFVEPVAGFKRKKIKLASQTGSRGFSKTIPHVGFAVKKPRARTVLGDNLQATVAPVSLYVNNVSGSDFNDGLSISGAKKTVSSALKALPPVLKHPVSITLVDSGSDYSIKDFQTVDLQIALFGDGETRSARYYSLGHIAFTMQESARFTVTKESTNLNRIVISGDQASFGDGTVSAFVVSSSRVIFNGIKFLDFNNVAVISNDSDVEFLDCDMDSNQQSVAATESSIIMNRGQMSLGELATGIVLVNSDLLVSGDVTLKANSPKMDSFFAATRSSNITLEKHDVQVNNSLEVNITSSIQVVKASLGSTVECNNTWVSNGQAVLNTNSVLSRSIVKNPFLAGITVDASSNVIIS